MSRDVDQICQEVCSQPQAIPSLLLFVALKEARAYKWYCSQQAGKDVGQKEIANWFKQHFSSWYREKWVDHMYGKRFWKEFGERQFNLAEKASTPDCELLSQIIESVSQYGENLGIILWADKTGQNMSEVIHVLKMLSINNHRMDIDIDQVKALSEALDEADKYKWIESEKAGKDLGEVVVMEWFKKYWLDYYKKMKERLDDPQK